MGNEIDGGLDRWIVEIERWRHDVVADREDREDRFDGTGCAEQMTDRRFRRRHRDLAGRVADDALDRAQFDFVAERADVLATADTSKQETKDAALAWKSAVEGADDEAVEAATAAATTSARLAISWPRTSAKSTS